MHCSLSRDEILPSGAELEGSSLRQGYREAKGGSGIERPVSESENASRELSQRTDKAVEVLGKSSPMKPLNGELTTALESHSFTILESGIQCIQTFRGLVFFQNRGSLLCTVPACL